MVVVCQFSQLLAESPIGPGGTCTINVGLTAPRTIQTISAELKVWARPSADGVQMPINISINGIVITPSAGANGIISPGTRQMVNYGSNFTFTAIPAAYSLVNQWFLDGAPVQTGGITYTLSNITSSHTVAVTFYGPLTVTPSAGTNGTISPSTAQPVTRGGSIVFTATPVTNASVNQWFLDNAPVQSGGLTYTLTNVTANHTVSVTFYPPFTVTPIAGSNGSINPSTPQVVANGSSILFTATPVANSAVNQWIVTVP